MGSEGGERERGREGGEGGERQRGEVRGEVERQKEQRPDNSSAAGAI
jgi:hypothetical protein